MECGASRRRFGRVEAGDGWDPGDRNAGGIPQWWNLLCCNEAFAAHLFSACLKTPTVSKLHILMTRAAAIGLVRLAQQTARAGGLRAFAFVIHEVNSNPLDETIDHLLLAGLLERNCQLVAVDLHHVAVAEFLVKHAVVE